MNLAPAAALGMTTVLVGADAAGQRRPVRAAPRAEARRLPGRRPRQGARMTEITLADLQTEIEAGLGGARRRSARPPRGRSAPRWRRRSPLLDAGKLRVGQPRRGRPLGDLPVGQAGRSCCRSAQSEPGDARRRAGGLRRRRRALVGQGRLQVRGLGRARSSRRRLSRRAGLDRAPRRLRRAERGADALVRQHRRLCRRRDHGRHLDHGRLLRPDRQDAAPFRRRRHRRGAGAAAGQPDHHRGRLLHRRPLGESPRA